MSAAPVAVGPMAPEDWDDVRRIYAEGIATGNATFETEPPAWEAWDRAHRADCRLVAREGPFVQGDVAPGGSPPAPARTRRAPHGTSGCPLPISPSVLRALSDRLRRMDETFVRATRA